MSLENFDLVNGIVTFPTMRWTIIMLQSNKNKKNNASKGSCHLSETAKSENAQNK